MAQCCCGKYQMDLTDPEFIHNEVVHQILGPPGNFCGAKHTHMVVRFEKEIEKLRRKIEEKDTEILKLKTDLIALKILKE
jgi:hypothetical protein